MSKQELFLLAVAAIRDESDALYELARQAHPNLALAHAHVLNGALTLLSNLEIVEPETAGRVR